MSIKESSGNANKGRRGGPSVEVVPPSKEEIRQGCEIIRKSWGDPVLRRELGLSPPECVREVLS